VKASTENFVGIYENAFSDEYCDDVIREFEKSVDCGFAKTRQQVNDMNKISKDDTAIWSGELYTSEIDLSGLHSLIAGQFNKVFWDQCYPHYANEFAALDGSGHHNVYGNKVQKTEVGQGYHLWHYESANRECCNRLLTHIVYLNDVEDGGETELLYFSKRFKPKKGTLILFPAAFTHTHRGNPPLSNDKYIITGWTEF